MDNWEGCIVMIIRIASPRYLARFPGKVQGNSPGPGPVTAKVLDNVTRAPSLSLVFQWRRVDSTPLINLSLLPKTMPKNTQNSSSVSRGSLRRNQVRVSISLSSCLLSCDAARQACLTCRKRKLVYHSFFFFLPPNLHLPYSSEM
jgi:hypothetical protein